MSRTRTFIAVALSDPIRKKLVALQDELADTGVEMKWVEPENLHVTMLFLGEVEDKEIAHICKIAQEAVDGMSPFAMTVERVGCFGNPRRPRTIWTGIGQGTQDLVAIHDNMEPPLFDLGYRREDRKFTPHITLGRVKSDRPTDKLAAALSQYAGWKAGDMTVPEVHIMGSELTPDGPVYTVLGRAKLQS